MAGDINVNGRWDGITTDGPIPGAVVTWNCTSACGLTTINQTTNSLASMNASLQVTCVLDSPPQSGLLTLRYKPSYLVELLLNHLQVSKWHSVSGNLHFFNYAPSNCPWIRGGLPVWVSPQLSDQPRRRGASHDSQLPHTHSLARPCFRRSSGPAVGPKCLLERIKGSCSTGDDRCRPQDTILGQYFPILHAK
jgi:hypothetical protein